MIGVVIFSASLPATRMAVGGFDPVFLTAARAVIATTLACALLLGLRQVRPARSDLLALTVVALGVVLGFPLLTALALRHIDAAHSLIYTGLLPLTTAIFAVLRGGERPRPAFWCFSLLGSLCVVGFALAQGGSGFSVGDLQMMLAIIVCGLGYAEGAMLARKLGGWQVICWALLLALPVMAVLAIVTLPASWGGIAASAWFGLVYVSVFSMLVGFIFWYRGLAGGGIAGVSQLQLLQPFMGLMLAATLLGETVSAGMVAVTLAVVLCVVGAKRFAGGAHTLAHRRPATGG